MKWSSKAKRFDRIFKESQTEEVLFGYWGLKWLSHADNTPLISFLILRSINSYWTVWSLVNLVIPHLSIQNETIALMISGC